jgi:hypothetical protein
MEPSTEVVRPRPHFRQERERTGHPALKPKSGLSGPVPSLKVEVRGWPTQRDVRCVGNWKDSWKMRDRRDVTLVPGLINQADRWLPVRYRTF